MRVPIQISATLALALAACTHGPRTAQASRPGEAFCHLYGRDHCLKAGWAALRGEGAPPDDRAAAASFMRGCETRDASSCADLAALYAAGRGVRRDDGRACELGLAEACVRAGRSPRAVARTPTAALPPAGPAPAATPVEPVAERVEYALDHARYFVDGDLHEALGLTREALEARPPASRQDLATVRRLAGTRKGPAAACLPVIRWTGGPVEIASVPGEAAPQRTSPLLAWATFTLDGDGRAADVRARVAGKEPDAPGWQRCIEEVIASWEFPVPRESGRVWLSFVGAGPEIEKRLPERDAAQAGAGYAMPTAKVPNCVGRSLRVPEGFEGFERTLVVKFAVRPDGSVRRFLVLDPEVPIPVARAISDAVHGCEWIAGRGADGAPVTLWVIVPIRFRQG